MRQRRPPRYTPPESNKPAANKSAFNYTTIAILGGIFILGIGVGIGFSSTTSLDPANVASREVIDRSAPNPEFCVQFGASAMVMDTRLYVTLNPFNVYVSQPVMRPGCVMRTNNWTVLEQKKLVTSQQVNDCKQRMNTFGYTGDLDAQPDIRCIYQNDAAQNFFVNQPGVTAPPAESNQF